MVKGWFASRSFAVLTAAMMIAVGFSVLALSEHAEAAKGSGDLGFVWIDQDPQGNPLYDWVTVTSRATPTDGNNFYNQGEYDRIYWPSGFSFDAFSYSEAQMSNSYFAFGEDGIVGVGRAWSYDSYSGETSTAGQISSWHGLNNMPRLEHYNDPDNLMAPLWTEQTECLSYDPMAAHTPGMHYGTLGGNGAGQVDHMVLSWDSWAMTTPGLYSGNVHQGTCTALNSYQVKAFDGSDIFEYHYDHVQSADTQDAWCYKFAVGHEQYYGYYGTWLAQELDTSAASGGCDVRWDKDDYAVRHWRNTPIDASNSYHSLVRDSVDNSINLDVSNDPLYYDTTAPTVSNGVMAGWPTVYEPWYSVEPKITYTPDSAYWGPDQITYTVADGYDSPDTATAYIYVNYPPEPVDDEFDIYENYPAYKAFEVRANDEDRYHGTYSTSCRGDYDTYYSYCLRVTAVEDPPKGSAYACSYTLCYKPDSGKSGADNFRVLVSDGVESRWSNVTIHINASPDAVNDEMVIDRDDVDASLDVLANDKDVYHSIWEPHTVNPEFHVSYVYEVDGHQIDISSDGLGLDVTAAPGFVGTSQFRYYVSDGQLTDYADITMHVNDGPDALDDTMLLQQGQASKTLTVTANDSDSFWSEYAGAATMPGVNVSAVSGGTLGTPTDNGDGTITYAPASPTTYGQDSFTYTVSDGRLEDTATVSVDINAVPSAVDDELIVPAWSVATFDVIANDEDPYFGSLSLDSVDDATIGAIAAISGSSVEYDATNGGYGYEAIEYTITDGYLEDTAFLDVYVNAAPVAKADEARVLWNTVDNGLYVLTNDNDPFYGGALEIVGVAGDGATISPDAQTLLYTPAAGWTGTAEVTYTISDGIDTHSAVVTIEVEEPDPVPRLVQKAPFTLDEGAAKAVDLSHIDASDDDSPLEDLSFIVLGSGDFGAFYVNGATGDNLAFTRDDLSNGGVVYMHGGDESTVDYVPVRVTDGVHTRDGTVEIQITPVNDAPAIVIDGEIVGEYTWRRELTPVVDIVDPDHADAEIDVEIVALPTKGSLILDNQLLALNDVVTWAQIRSGAVEYEHAGGDLGADSFGIQATDAGGAQSPTTAVPVYVWPANEPPSASSQGFMVDQGKQRVLTGDNLYASDDYDGPSGIQFYVSHAERAGILLHGVAVGPNDYFTLQDVIDGSVTYVHSGADHRDGGVYFEVRDSTEHYPGLFSIGLHMPVRVVSASSIADDMDADGDGVVDTDAYGNTVDNCIGTANADQADSDVDAAGDACDDVVDPLPEDAAAEMGIFPEEPEPEPQAPDLGGSAEIELTAFGDGDNDGYDAGADNCPSIANPTQVDSDGDKRGDVCDDDRDGDGVPQIWPETNREADNCPDVANPNQKDRDGDGIGDACDSDAEMHVQSEGGVHDRSGSSEHIQSTMAEAKSSGKPSVGAVALAIGLMILCAIPLVVMTLARARR